MRVKNNMIKQDTVSPHKMPERISITKAENGFIVSKYGDKGEEQIVCKDKDEMMNAVGQMMVMKEMENKKKMKEYRMTSDGKMKIK